MDAPKCRICGKKHYGICGGSIESDVRDVTPEEGGASPPRHPNICPACGTDLGKKTSRKLYMREYMRRYRRENPNREKP